MEGIADVQDITNHWIGHYLIFKPVKDKIRIDVITDILQLLRYRYMITERVTFHHARCAANAMLIKAAQLLGGSEETFYWMGDDDFVNHLIKSKNREIKELGENLKYRNLYKTAFRVTSYTALELKEGDVGAVSKKYGKPEGREELEEKLTNEITKVPVLNDFKRHHIAIYCPPDENMNFKETKVLILWRGEEPTPLTDLTPRQDWEYQIVDEVKAMEEKYKALWNMYIFVHPKFSRKIYAIERCCEKVLGVKNDPLLTESFGQTGDYKECKEYETMFSKKETEIVTTAKEISRRGKTKKENLNEAIRQVTLPIEEEDEETRDTDLQEKKRSQR